MLNINSMIRYACMLSEYFCDFVSLLMISELLCLESSTIMLRYSDLYQYVKNGTTMCQTV